MPEDQKPDLGNKAIQIIVVGGSAAGLAAASGASPTVILAAGAAASSGQTSELVSGVWARLRERWNRNGQATLEAGARAADMDLDKFLLRLLSSPARQELLASALEGGAHATVDAKIKAIGAALARGALAETPAEVDHQRFFVQAMAEFEVPHVRVLDVIATAQKTDPSGIATRKLSEEWAPEILFPLLATLERRGAVISHGQGPIVVSSGPAGEQMGPGGWTASDFGLRCLDRLRAAGLEEELDAQ